MEKINLKKIKQGDVLVIHWKDATLRSRQDRDEIIIPSAMLEDSVAVGIVGVLDFEAISLLQNFNDNTRDVITIPLSLITKVDYYNKN